jgi:hypothetical protein
MASFPVRGDKPGPVQDVQVIAHSSGAHLHLLGEAERGCGPVQLGWHLAGRVHDQGEDADQCWSRSVTRLSVWTAAE